MDEPASRSSQPRARLLALHWFDVCSPWRVNIPLDGLRRLGYEVREAPIAGACDPGGADLLVLHRPSTKAALGAIERARERGIPVVVDVDDLFLPEALPAGAPFSQTWHPLFHRREAERRAAAGLAGWDEVEQAPRNEVMERLHACLRLADAVTVTTPPLAAAYAAFNPRVEVLPNCYDDGNPLWSLRPPPRATVNIGFCGSDHHADNLAVLRGALEPVLRAHPDVRVVEGGGPELLPLIEAPPEQLVHLGSLPFATFPLLLHQMDVVLAPLADHPFMRCKSNIRCMTAGLVGAPVVASPVGPYAEYVRPGRNGLHARSPAEWTDGLERLLSDPALRRRLGEANRQAARAYAMSRNLWRWVEVYESLLGRRGRSRPRSAAPRDAAGAPQARAAERSPAGR